MNVDLSSSTILQGLTTIIMAGMGFWFRSIHSDFKAALSKIADHEIKLALLDEKVKRLEDK